MSQEPYPSENSNFTSEDVPNTVYITRYVFLKEPTTINDVIPFVFVFGVYCVIIHSIFLLLKKSCKPVYNILTFLLIIVFPPLTMAISKDYVFFLIWLCLFSLTLYCINVARRKSLLLSKNPRNIYKVFKVIFFYTNVLILTSQVLIFVSVVLRVGLLNYFLRLLVYSLYFAVFCREIMVNLSETMAFTVSRYKKESVPCMVEDKTKCLICGELLKVQSKPSRIEKALHLENDDRVVTLSCKHSFHGECIKGWTILGQKKNCIYCQAGIDNSIIEVDLWLKTESFVRPLCNFLRSTISFFVVLYGFLWFRLRSN